MNLSDKLDLQELIKDFFKQRGIRKEVDIEIKEKEEEVDPRQCQLCLED